MVAAFHEILRKLLFRELFGIFHFFRGVGGLAWLLVVEMRPVYHFDKKSRILGCPNLVAVFPSSRKMCITLQIVVNGSKVQYLIFTFSANIVI